MNQEMELELFNVSSKPGRIILEAFYDGIEDVGWVISKVIDNDHKITLYIGHDKAEGQIVIDRLKRKYIVSIGGESSEVDRYPLLISRLNP